MSRKLAREIAFKVIFSDNFKVEAEEQKEKNSNLINSLIEDKELIRNEDEFNISDSISEEDKIYIESVAKAVHEKEEELDNTIKKYLKGWTMERISKTALAILRLAVYEIKYREDIPYKVSINEAVELAKLYCDDTAPSFINGVLAGVLTEISDDTKVEE